MSLSATRLQPSPTAGPLTAATTGIRHRAIPSTISRPSAMVLARRSASPANSSRYAKSPPAENALPAPVSTAARAVRSSLSRCHIRASPECRLSLTELRESGRFRVMMRSAPSARTSISAGMSYTSDSQSQDSRSDDVLLYLRCAAHDALRAAVQIVAEQVRIAGPGDRQCRVTDGLLDPGHQE